MNYLILSPIGLSFFLVPHLGRSREVKNIYFHYYNQEIKHFGKDMDKMEGWEKLILVSDPAKALNNHSKEDITIFIDDVGMGETGKFYRSLGYKVIGGTPFTDKIEDNRQFATDLMSRIMKVPESHEFSDFESGMQYAKTLDKDTRLVFKPSDSAVPKEYTYVSKNIQDLLSAMKDFKSEWKWGETFQLQYLIKGQEMDFNAYINAKGEYMKDSMFYYFENKPVMDGDIGPATGGSIAVQFSRKLEGKFYDILDKLRPALVKSGYVGQIAINSIISEEDKEPYFLEFCGRVGYPSFPMDVTAIEETGKTVHDFFQALVNGENISFFPTNKVEVTVSVGISPYPSKEGADKNKGLPVSWDKKWNEYFFPYYVMYDDKKKMVMSGIANDLLNITCSDATIDGATAMLYDTYIPSLKVKNPMYRTDLGKSAKERIKKLHEWKVI